MRVPVDDPEAAGGIAGDHVRIGDLLAPVPQHPAVRVEHDDGGTGSVDERVPAQEHVHAPGEVDGDIGDLAGAGGENAEGPLDGIDVRPRATRSMARGAVVIGFSGPRAASRGSLPKRGALTVCLLYNTNDDKKKVVVFQTSASGIALAETSACRPGLLAGRDSSAGSRRERRGREAPPPISKASPSF